MTSRSYVFTSFNLNAFSDFGKKYKSGLNEKIRYIIFQHEICPTSQKEHIQGYLEFFSPKRIAGTKKLLNDNSIHLEKRRGTREEAQAYCKKKDTRKPNSKPEEYGSFEKGGQGKRNDLKEIIEKCETIEQLMDEHPDIYCKFRSGLKDIYARKLKKNTKKFRNVHTTLISGETGVGKTRKCVEAEENFFLLTGDQLKKGWFDGYESEKCLIIDEYNNQVDITELLSLLDGYQKRLNVKGSFTYANWEKVYITTNLKLHEIHSKAKKAHRDALKRRIHTIEEHWPSSLKYNWEESDEDDILFLDEK